MQGTVTSITKNLVILQVTADEEGGIRIVLLTKDKDERETTQTHSITHDKVNKTTGDWEIEGMVRDAIEAQLNIKNCTKYTTWLQRCVDWDNVTVPGYRSPLLVTYTNSG